MGNLAKNLLCAFFGLSSGVFISGAVFAFIAVIGVVPRLAQKTGTERNIRLYEEAFVAGGALGTYMYFFSPGIPIGSAAAAVSLLSGIFYGSLAVSLAEVLNAIPILAMRVNVKRGLQLFILIIAIGKLAGSLGYFIIPGFKK